jgi:hypothetical protein
MWTKQNASMIWCPRPALTRRDRDVQEELMMPLSHIGSCKRLTIVEMTTVQNAIARNNVLVEKRLVDILQVAAPGLVAH